MRALLAAPALAGVLLLAVAAQADQRFADARSRRGWCGAPGACTIVCTADVSIRDCGPRRITQTADVFIAERHRPRGRPRVRR